MEDLEVPYLEESAIADTALNLVLQYHPSLTAPVPIEHIVEHELGIDVVPVNGLRYAFGFDAFISSNLKEIHVDLAVLNKYMSRYHFTLAHELAHHQLHGEFYGQFSFSSIEQYMEVWEKCFQAEANKKAYARLEWQANMFAGLVLVPAAPLEEELGAVIDIAAREGVDVASRPEFAHGYVCGVLAKTFEVSSEVIRIRLEKEGLWPPK